MATLRQRAPRAASKSSSLVQPRDESHGSSSNPSGERKKKARTNYLPAAIFIIVNALVVFVILTIFLSDEGSRRTLRSALFGTSQQLHGPVNYSKLPLCIAHYDDMPDLWRPPFVPDGEGGLVRLFMNEETGEPRAKDPWTPRETEMAQHALWRALDEIIYYYDNEMTEQEILQFQPDGINSLLDMAFSQKGNFQHKALMAARKQFINVVTPNVDESSDEAAGDDGVEEAAADQNQGGAADDDGGEEKNEENEGGGGANGEDGEDSNEEEKGKGDDDGTDERRMLMEANDSNDDQVVVAAEVRRHQWKGCTHQSLKMKLLNYGHYIVEQLGRETVKKQDPKLQKAYVAAVESVREMIQACGTLDNILGVNVTLDLFEDPTEDSDVVYGYLMNAIALVELKTIPEIDLPMPRTDWFVANLWKYFATYDLLYARDHPRHYWDSDTMDHAWLATDIAYLLTGYGRHKIEVEDAPYLYQYIRENFYYAMEHGRIDLISKFVDLVRAYGCTEENDYQLRDGTRFVLHQFYENQGGKWIDYDKPNNHYNRINIPWAGSAAVMLNGDDEPVVPGSYGYAFYSILRNQMREEIKVVS